MSNNVNAAPRVILQGIKDVSGRPAIREPELFPTHMPHCHLYAEWGPTNEPQAVAASFNTVFGHKTLDPRSKFYNHQSALAAAVIGEGNMIYATRLKPQDAPAPARLLFSLDIVEEEIQQYERDSAGQFRRNAQGEKIAITGVGATLPGHRARWVINDYTAGSTTQEFGQVTSKVGAITNSSTEQSTVYPIFELEAAFFGSRGNHIGARLLAPSLISNVPVNAELVEATKAYVYRLSILTRDDADSSALVHESLQGEQSIDFTFKQGTVDKKLNREVSLDSTFFEAYQDLDSIGTTKIYAPFGRVKIYHQYLEQLLAAVGALEAPAGTLPVSSIDEDSQYLHLVNLFTATSVDGTPYYTLALDEAAQGGLRFSDSTTVWAAGGGDGTMTFASHDAQVRTEMQNYGKTGTGDLLDTAKFPLSFYYDSGYSIDTKMAMLTVLGARKDVAVVLSTQDASQPLNTPSQDSSMSVTLKNAARLYPESEIHGTKVCRVVVVPNAGTMIGSTYRSATGSTVLPFTLEFAAKCAAYMGAGTGVWNPAAAFDDPNNNVITMFKDHNVVFRGADARARDWENGLISAQTYDTRSVFWAGIQTVYDDDTSILNSFFNMAIAVDLEKVAQRAWRDLTGISGKLSPGQFIQRSNGRIMELVEGKYDDRVEIRPDTYFTKADEQLGYRWTTDIHMFGENMRTVGTYTVVAHRSSDLAVAA